MTIESMPVKIKAKRMLTELYEYYSTHPEKLSREYLELIEPEGSNPVKILPPSNGGIGIKFNAISMMLTLIPARQTS